MVAVESGEEQRGMTSLGHTLSLFFDLGPEYLGTLAVRKLIRVSHTFLCVCFTLQ